MSNPYLDAGRRSRGLPAAGNPYLDAVRAAGNAPLQSPAAVELTEAAHKVVKVRAHTRTIKPKPARTTTPAATNTQTVRPAQVSTEKRLVPHRPDEPIAGYVGALQNPDRSWAKPGGRAVPGASLAERPYYTDAFTTHRGAGPKGQASTQLNAAQVAQAKSIQAENYGKVGVALRSVLPGGLDEGGINTSNAVSRVASVATTALPGGGVGEAAGVIGFGLKGLKALRGGRAAKGVSEAAPEAAKTYRLHARPEPGPAVPANTHFYNQVGDYLPKKLNEQANLTADNIHDEHGNVIGSIVHDSRPDRSKIYVESVFIRPEFRNAANFKRLLDPILEDGRPIDTDISNPRLLKIFQRFAEKRGVGDTAKVAPGLESIGRGEKPLGLQPLRETGTVAEGPVNATEAAAGAAHVTEEAAAIRGALPGAKILRGKQEAGYSAERSKRVAAARVHLDNPNLAPDERVRLAKRELAGELPKINFQGFSELNDESLKALQEHVLNHPHLMPFQKIRTSDALVNALAGKVPTRGEITLLEHVFGKETAAGLDSLTKHPFKDTLLNALNIPRSLMASFDLSAPFRQGLVVATRHPKIFAQNFGPMIKAFGSEKVYHGMIDEIRARPSYPLMVEAKLPLTELGADVGGREERFASSYAETLTGGKYSPVRASGRAYTGFLDKTRADVFDHLIKQAQSQGQNVQDQHFLQSLGRYIGSATGRGQLRHFEQAAPALNAIFFSPRLMASRFNFINPAYYKRLDPFARKEALRSALQLAGTASTLVALASRVPGVKVQTDPRNPDWGKIKIGNTRVDIGGGFQQELRFLAQIASGVAISSTTGKRLSLTSGGFGQPTRLDIAERYFMGKESPIASLVTDYLRGSTQIGEKFSWDKAAAQRLSPLLAQSSLELYKEQHGGINGLAAAFAGYGVGSLGFGVQTYGPGKPKTSPSAPRGGNPYLSSPSGRSGNPYLSSPSGRGGNPYLGR